MKKKLITAVGLMLTMAVTQARALSGACEGFSGTVTDSGSQAFWYVACIGEQLSQAWDLFYNYF